MDIGYGTITVCRDAPHPVPPFRSGQGCPWKLLSSLEVRIRYSRALRHAMRPSKGPLCTFQRSCSKLTTTR